MATPLIDTLVDSSEEAKEKNISDDQKGDGGQHFKILMLGDAGVGKTSLVKRFVNNDFQKYYIETVGIDYMERLVEIPANAAYEATIDNVTYKVEDTTIGDIEVGVDLVQLQIWDTAGQDRFRSIVRPYYRGAAGVVLVYDVTDKGSFTGLSAWLSAVKQYTNPGQVLHIVVVGNKMDLASHHKINMSSSQVMDHNMDLTSSPATDHNMDLSSSQVTEDMVKEFVEEHKLSTFLVSAKTGDGVAEAFSCLARNIARSTGSIGCINRKEPAIRLEVDSHEEQGNRRKCCAII